MLELAAALVTVALAVPHATSPAPQAPAFEVASIKPQPWTGNGSVGIFIRGNTLDAEHVSVFDLITYAYDLRDLQVSGGPSWIRRGVLISSELYQVLAKAPDGPPPTREAFRQMLQALLADRCKLQIHHAEKEFPIYNLVVNAGGPRLKENVSDAKFNFVTSSRGQVGIRIVATHMTMQQLIDHQLGGYTGRPVFDKTGLSAAYDFTLEFIPETLPPEQQAGPNDPPPLAAAVREQLGLKLESGKAPFDTIVIDRVEKPEGN